jgi:hypothetical protein
LKPARREDWPERLLAFVEERRATPFGWGVNDCALFAADAALAMTGHDFAAPFRGRYRTAAGARRALRANGAASLEDFVTQALGAPVAPALARRGDVVLFDAIDGPALGVALGAQAAAAGPAGTALVPLARWVKGWRV